MSRAAPVVPPVALVGLKAYLTHAQTLAWFADLVELVESGRAAGVSIVLAPAATALATLAPAAERAGVQLAAQDCSVFGPGAATGELPASLLAEVGARHVMVGHAERRRQGETDDTVARKVAATAAAGLAPIVCVGEPERTSVEAAVAAVGRQLDAALAVLPFGHPVMVAYEPVWSIGAEAPAASAHIVGVAERLRARLEGFPAATIVYGGAAGPGTFDEIAHAVDGLGLGRRVHETAALAEVFEELRGAGRTDGSQR